MNTPPKFVKAYTRDFSIIMEEAWYHALARGLWERIAVPMPAGCPNFYRFNQGIIEVWENKQFIQSIINGIRAKRNSSVFFDDLLIDYKLLVEALKDNTIKDEVYLKTLFKAVTLFSIVWYGILDNKTDSKLRKRLVGVRDRDTIFDTNDKIVRKRILRKYPNFYGFETTLVKEEFLGTPPRAAILKKRLRDFIIIPGKYAASTDLSIFAAKHHFSLELFSQPKNFTIKGMVANRGRAVGRVRVIRKKNEVKNMKRGEVLISPMTTPDVFPAMRKAVAIVTDEGGSLCHAAIMSRELGIPCIIGTKVASELYQNGDRVTVDAVKGIVKKIMAA